MPVTRLLQEYLARQAELRPDAPAITMGDDCVRYRDVDVASNRIARLLEELGCTPGDRVCLFLPKSPVAIAAMLGTLKAGCVYVPIDVTSPATRYDHILRSADPRVIVTTESVEPRISELDARGSLDPRVHVGFVDVAPRTTPAYKVAFTPSDWTGLSGESVECTATSRDPAHILYTSGSTGVPKGVVITHANVIHFIEWARGYFDARSTDRVSSHPPLFFDLSTFDIYGTFAAGAHLHLIPPGLSLLPHKLADYISETALTQWFSVPSILTYMAKHDVGRGRDFSSLTRILWCGEQMPTPTLRYWMTHVPHASFTNLYGPTETTIASTYYTVPAMPQNETDPIPLGSPCSGEEVLVLDDDLQPTEADGIGSIYIGGVGLSPGYWRDEERTRIAFRPDHRPAHEGGRLYLTGDLARVSRDGEIYFVGRSDSQIKSRGHRIELGEIEVALSSLADVTECAVVGISTEGFEGTIICCAFVRQSDSDVSPAQLRHALVQRLPGYMIPSQWATLDRLPKNANGKTDRGELRRLFEQRISHG